MQEEVRGSGAGGKGVYRRRLRGCREGGSTGLVWTNMPRISSLSLSEMPSDSSCIANECLRLTIHWKCAAWRRGVVNHCEEGVNHCEEVDHPLEVRRLERLGRQRERQRRGRAVDRHPVRAHHRELVDVRKRAVAGARN